MGRKAVSLWLLIFVVMTLLVLISGALGYQRLKDQQHDHLHRWGDYYVSQLRSADNFRFDPEQLALQGYLLRYARQGPDGLEIIWENDSRLPVSLLDHALRGQRHHTDLPVGEQQYYVLALPVGSSTSLVLAVPEPEALTVIIEQTLWELAAVLGLLFVVLAFSQHRARMAELPSVQESLSWEHMPGIAFLVSQSRFLSEVNPQFQAVFGEEDCRKLDDLLPDDELARVVGFIDQALDSNVMIDFECSLRDQYGEAGRWALHAKPWGGPEQRILLLTGEDISKRHYMEQELRSEQQRVAAYFDAMQTLLVICDQYGNIERINHRTQMMLDMTEEQLIGSPVRNMLPKSQLERLLGLWQQLIGTDQETLSLECPMVSATGKEAIVSWRITKVEDDRGRLEVVLAGLDITESVANREALEKANDQIRETLNQAENANRSKSVFLANMSHEIRTPMNGILGAAELLLDSHMTDDQRNYLEIIHSSSHVLLDIINDILDLSKIESGKLEIETIDFDLNKLLADLHQLFREPARRKGLGLVYFYSSDIPTRWRGDPKRIRQIITNLLSNALKFTENGRIELRVDARECDRGLQLAIQVKDSGIGISAEKIQRVFTAFRQADSSTSRKYGGTGLGLTISRHLAQAMSGDILVESELGRGSCFTLQMLLQPARIQAAEKDKAAVTTPQPASKPETKALHGNVLLAEDNQVNQRIAEKMLQRLGLRCHIVENGEQAVSEVLQKDYDLILMDVNMPVLDGISATERIRDLSYPKNQVPILALTANAMMEDKDRCLSAGMNGFVSKPIRLDALGEAIAAILQRSDGSPASE